MMEIQLSKDMLNGDFKILFPDEAQARVQRTHVYIKLIAASEDDEDYLYSIIEYLDETCPDPPLLPADPLARARVRSLAQLIASDIHPQQPAGQMLRYPTLGSR